MSKVGPVQFPSLSTLWDPVGNVAVFNLSSVEEMGYERFIKAFSNL